MPTVSTTESKPFVDDTRTAVFGLRRALADILSSVHANPDEPQELSRRFGLDKTLTWRITRVIRAEDPWEAVPHIPRRPSIGIFTRALSKHGASAQHVESVLKALNEFERCVEVHSGDRETLEMMLGAQPRGATAKRMEAFRKSGFQANSAIWGVRARFQISLHMMAPSRLDPDKLSLTTIAGLVDFRRLRPDVPWSIAALAQWDGASTELPVWAPSAIDPTLSPGSPPLLHDFCSPSSPELRVVKENQNLVRYMLAEGAVGNTAAATVVFGWNYASSVSCYESYPGEEGEHGVLLSTPVETVVHDLFVHRSLRFAQRPAGFVYSQLPGGPHYPDSGREASLLPVSSEVVDLGEGPPDTTTPEMSRYGELVEIAAAANGHKVTDFHGYRFRIKYPPIPAIAILRHKLLPFQGTTGNPPQGTNGQSH